MSAEARRRKLVSPAEVRRLLGEHGIRPRRSLGQNFLVDPNVLEIILRAARLSRSDTVIEVGAGLGALTQALIESAGTVCALESDPGLVRILEKELGHAGNLLIIGADAARFDFGELRRVAPSGRFKMVANLPYRIAATLLIDCLYDHPWIEEYIVTVQREIAERLTSEAGDSNYSAATVKVRRIASVSRVARVSRNSFYPRPRVDSAVIRIERLKKDTERGFESLFDRVVTTAFSQRRKKLVNSLSSSGALQMQRRQLRDILTGMGKNPECRAEELTPEDFEKLSLIMQSGRK